MLVYPQHKPAAVRCHLVKLPGFCRLQVQLSRNLKQCTGTKTNYGWFFFSPPSGFLQYQISKVEETIIFKNSFASLETDQRWVSVEEGTL